MAPFLKIRFLVPVEQVETAILNPTFKVSTPSTGTENRIFKKGAESVKTTHRKISDIIGCYNCPPETAIKNLKEKFDSAGSENNIPTKAHVSPGCSAENIDCRVFF